MGDHDTALDGLSCIRTGDQSGGARMTSQTTSRKLTVQEAAEILGTSVDAVRMRTRRGSLESEKDPDAWVYVWVDPDE